MNQKPFPFNPPASFNGMMTPVEKKSYFLPPSVFFLLVFILFYVVAGWLLALSLGVADKFQPVLYFKAVLLVSLLIFLFFVGWRAARMMMMERPRHLTRALAADIRNALFTPEKLVQILLLFAGFLLFISAFTSIKSLIPLIQPYRWDMFFADMDRALHFGVDPWLLLQPILGYPLITSALNILYNLWFVVMFAVLYWQLFDLRKPALRLRFFWTFFLTWAVNGTMLAMLFSSAGPCFYALVAQGENPFAAQMDYLRRAAEDYPVWAVSTQDMLWRAYENNVIGLGSGISAMPSVHVAMVTLFALLARHYHPFVKWMFIAFAFVIMVGSVHLAWHYAVDGYLGALVTILLWFATGRMLQEENKR